jgi:hypothetical protein
MGDEYRIKLGDLSITLERNASTGFVDVAQAAPTNFGWRPLTQDELTTGSDMAPKTEGEKLEARAISDVERARMYEKLGDAFGTSAKGAKARIEELAGTISAAVNHEEARDSYTFLRAVVAHPKRRYRMTDIRKALRVVLAAADRQP